MQEWANSDPPQIPYCFETSGHADKKPARPSVRTGTTKQRDKDVNKGVSLNKGTEEGKFSNLDFLLAIGVLGQNECQKNKLPKKQGVLSKKGETKEIVSNKQFLTGLGVLGQPLNVGSKPKIQTSREDRKTRKPSPSTKSETRKVTKKIDQGETSILTYQNNKKDKREEKH